MSSHEARINDALRQLGEEFRLGMVQAQEYRSRRRALIESWGEVEATTSPGSLRSKTATTAPNRGPAAAAAAAAAAATPSPARSSVMVPVIVIVLIVGAVIAGYLALKPKAPAGAPAAAEALSAPVVAARKAADDFLAANAWDEAGVEAFLQVWRTLDAGDRAKASELPSLRTLRYRLEQNLQAETQVVAPDAPPEERQRLQLLERFARELGGGQ